MTIRVPTPPPPDVRQAARWLMVALLLYLTGLGIGTRWDRAWHVTQPFDDFWSPPHLFTYTMVALTTAVLVRLALSQRLRAAFGLVSRLAPLSLSVPSALLLAGGGMLLLGLAGTMDFVWHSAFGLDETGWSFPHALLGWGSLLAFLGMLACRLALRPAKPMVWYSRLVFGTLALLFVSGVLLGPIGSNATPETVRAVGRIAVLADNPDFQHTQRIYLTWNLTRLHPLFVLLSAFVAGIALTLGRGISSSNRLWLAMVTVVTLLALASERGTARYLGELSDARAWLPLPLLPAALVVLVGLRLHLPERGAWLLAGALFGGLVVWIWGASPALVLIAAPLLLLGARVGEWTAIALECPTRARVLTMLGAGLMTPVLTGGVDLWLRAVTA